MQSHQEKIQSAHLYQAFALLKKKDFAAAETHLSAGLKEAQDAGDTVLEAVYHSTFGVLHKLKQEFRKAWKCYERAEKLLPEDPALKIISARLLIDYFSQYDAAIRKMDKVLELAKGDFSFAHQAYSIQGLARLKKGDKKGAAESLAQSMGEGFKGLQTAANLDLSLVEALLKKKTEVEQCRRFLELALAFCKKTRELQHEKLIRRLLELFPKA